MTNSHFSRPFLANCIFLHFFQVSFIVFNFRLLICLDNTLEPWASIFLIIRTKKQKGCFFFMEPHLPKNTFWWRISQGCWKFSMEKFPENFPEIFPWKIFFIFVVEKFPMMLSIFFSDLTSSPSLYLAIMCSRSAQRYELRGGVKTFPNRAQPLLK